MSKQSNEIAKCPQCGAELIIRVWQSVNVDLDPEQRKNILDGSFFIFVCEKCGNRVNCIYPFLYHDITHRYMVYMTPVRNDQEFEEMLAEKDRMFKEIIDVIGNILIKKNDYRYRTVFSPAELIEKIHILDNGYDDRAIEVMKVFYLAELDTQIDGEHIKRILFDCSADQPSFIIILENGESGTSDFVDSMYNSIMERMYSDLVEFTQEGFIYVDRNWVLEFMHSNDQ